MNPYEIIIRPIVTEKGTALKEKNNQYLFQVKVKSTKGQVKQAVETLFKVKVKKVVTMITGGKKQRLRMGAPEGRRPDWKKAIVTVAEGQRIDLEEKV
ncbi:MAG: 50S ribosomal protein L23 [Elusimicrobiota bacterium]